MRSPAPFATVARENEAGMIWLVAPPSAVRPGAPAPTGSASFLPGSYPQPVPDSSGPPSVLGSRVHAFPNVSSKL